jgi:hypothetical protein
MHHQVTTNKKDEIGGIEDNITRKTVMYHPYAIHAPFIHVGASEAHREDISRSKQSYFGSP